MGDDARTGRPAGIQVVSLRAAIITAFFCMVAGGTYTAAGLEPLPIVSLFLSAGPLIAVILWLQEDAHRTQVAAVHDLGLFVWFAWLVVIPWYAWKTRGRAWWRLTLGLYALIGSAYVGQVLGAVARNLQRE